MYNQMRNLPACVRSTKLLLRILISLPLALFLNVQVSTATDTQEAANFLKEYGYLGESSGTISLKNGESLLSKALTEFQSFYGLPTTGRPDKQTLKLMKTPRCGVKDKIKPSFRSRSKRYTFMTNERWKRSALTYRINNYPSKFVYFRDGSRRPIRLPNNYVDEAIKNALNIWSAVTNLKFTRKRKTTADIEISFVKGFHNCDGGRFDGKGNTLAHAFDPGSGVGGDAHFDDDELWTYGTARNGGTNLFLTAAHEFGHSLGLGHSNVKSALMYAYTSNVYNPNPLHADDIAGIQRLYGKKKRYARATLDTGNSSAPFPDENTSSTEEPLVIDDVPDLCTAGAIDTIFKGPDGETFVFKGDWYWKVLGKGIDENYPRLITEDWPGLPSNINAAFTFGYNNKTYFFKGSQYWRYSGKRLDGNYPRAISDGFEGIPDCVDAALVWNTTGEIYFFKGSQFWKFDAKNTSPLANNPRPISEWEGIPNNLDAAFEHTNGHTYFFKNGEYWRFNRKTLKVDSAEPAYPRSAPRWWFGCSDATEGTLNDL